WVFLGLVISNLWTGWLFTYDAVNGYLRGPLKNATYITMGIYQIIEVLTVYHNHRKISKHIRVVFYLYPVIALAIMLIQFRFTWYVMTGTGVFAPLLLIYLTIQSELAEVDVSTGLFTGKMLEHELGHSITGAVCYITIDDFSDLIESLGSDNARQLEFQISKRLIETYGSTVYYLEGGRYIVIADSVDTVKEHINEVLRETSSFTTDNNFTFHLELHAAVFTVPDNALNYGQSMELAVDLIQFAKNHKQKICYCDENYQNQCARDTRIYDILLRELHTDSEQFQICFQPIWSLKEQKFTYAEALSRLFNTELGTIRPDEFIRIAENKGLIERLGNVAFEKICRFLSEHKDVLKAVSVNFSVYQMMNPNVVSNVLNTIAKYGLKPENIIMEITESIFIDDFDTIRDHMLELSKAGIIFYLDDFGTGYSNFANVLTLPFTTIKIDRSLVLSMETDQRNYQFLKNLMASFKSNGVTILTEGVETEVQDTMVKEAGADYIQGYLYSKPISQQDCIKLIRES
ncbi:MAG: GGDEF domain-containing phosphodiesterase, partial [Treponemataceae bacterium]|nr:GGDEF domain-containing phosphodiesterase [Treponemataceae bacterium]